MLFFHLRYAYLTAMNQALVQKATNQLITRTCRMHFFGKSKSVFLYPMQEQSCTALKFSVSCQHVHQVACKRRRISGCRLSPPKITSANPTQETISVRFEFSANHSSAQVTPELPCKVHVYAVLDFHSIKESDWPKRNKSHYVTEIVSWLGIVDVIFGGDKQQAEVCLQAINQAVMRKIIRFFVFYGVRYPCDLKSQMEYSLATYQGCFECEV